MYLCAPDFSRKTQSKSRQILDSADPFAIHQVCLRWLHSVLHPHPFTVTLQLPQRAFGAQPSAATTPLDPPNNPHAASSAKPHPTTSIQTSPSEQPLPIEVPPQSQSDMQGLLPVSLVCRVVSEVTQLSPHLTHPWLCPCHGGPVLQASPDAQEHFCGCSVSAAGFRQSELKQSRSMIQVCTYTFALRLEICTSCVLMGMSVCYKQLCFIYVELLKPDIHDSGNLTV